MTWRNRFRLLAGLVLVVVVVGSLTVFFSLRKGEAESLSGSVQAVTFPVGTDYAGPVIEQFVSAGDPVAVGDPILTIRSADLLAALERAASSPRVDPPEDNEVYDLHDDGTLTLLSTVNGTVESTDVLQGAYAPTGVTLATIAATENLFVSAEFDLDPQDYGRIEQGARVDIELPDRQMLIGRVERVEVETINGRALAVVEVRSDQLTYEEHGQLAAPGTPVRSIMQLRNEDALAVAVDELLAFISDTAGSIRRASE